MLVNWVNMYGIETVLVITVLALVGWLLIIIGWSLSRRSYRAGREDWEINPEAHGTYTGAGYVSRKHGRDHQRRH